MTLQNETTLEISYPKALMLSVFFMASFVLGLFFAGFPLHDPLLVSFLFLMVIAGAFLFAAGICFMFRCKINHDGLRSAVPTFYQRILQWEDVAHIQGIASPFYVIRGRAFGGFCLLPRQFFLKRPESLKELIRQYAPADNIVRKKLG